MPIDVNFDRVTGPIPEGIHPFQILEMSLSDEPGPSGYHYVSVKLSCLSEGPNMDKHVYTNLSLSPSARFKMEEFLDAVGAPHEGSGDLEDFVGERVRCQIKVDAFEGVDRAAVAKMLPWDENATNIKPEVKDLSRLESKRKRSIAGKKVEDLVDLDEEAEPPVD